MSTVRYASGMAWQASNVRSTDGSTWSDAAANKPVYVSNSSSGQYRALGQSIATSFGSITPLANDLGIISVIANNGARASTPVGWTEIAADEDTTNQRYRQIFIKLLGAGETGPTLTQDVSLANGGQPQPWGYGSLIVRGANTSSVIDGTPEVTHDLSQAIYLGGATHASAKDGLLVVIASQSNNSNRSVVEYYSNNPSDTTTLSDLELNMELVYNQTTTASHHVFVQTWPHVGPVNWRYFYWSAQVAGGAVMFIVKPTS